jgi:multimeric flavodoxin WrbA
MAKACLLGAKKEEEIEIRYKKALETSLDDVIWADGIIIGTPEYFGNMCGALKDFFDRTYYPASELEINLPYALFICCENDGSGAERNVDTIASGYVLKKALNTLIIKEKDLESRLSELEEMGHTFAAGVALGIF